MSPATLSLEPAVVLFYSRIACCVGIPPEEVLSGALLKLTEELRLKVLYKD